MSPVSTKALDSYPVHSLVAFARTALGCGIGMMVANKFQRSSTRQTTAIALLSVGVLGSLPWLVQTVVGMVNRPGSERVMQRRLESIRENAGFQNGVEMF